MDFDFGGPTAGRRRVNLGGASASAATQSRADAVEAARRERERRGREKQREQAAMLLQAWWRSRRQHVAERAKQRTAWDAELVQLATAAQAGGPGVPARVLQRFVSRYFFFSRLAPPRPCDAAVPPARQSAAAAATAAADLTRFRHLVKLLLASLRHADRQQHLGSLILASPANVALQSGALLASAAHWLHVVRKLLLVLLPHVGDTRRFAMDASVANEIMLLWLLLDAAQWPFVKTQATPAEKAVLQQTQAELVASVVTRSSYARRRPSSRSANSQAASPKPAAVTPAPIDVMQCIRARLLDLTVMSADGTPSAAQVQQKTSVALLVATVIRCVTLLSLATLDARGVLSSFVYYVFSIPALPQRLRYMGLAALLPSFVTPAVFDRSMDTVAAEVRRLNVRAPLPPDGLDFSRNVFASMSYTAHDQPQPVIAAPVPRRAPADESKMDLTCPSPHASSAASAAAASSASAIATAASSSSPTDDATDRTPLSGVAWLLGNCLEFVTLLDESKSAAASRSFSHFLAAVEQLIQAVPEKELPVLGQTNARSALPPVFVRQCALFGERSFLDRLCRRLLAEPALAAPASGVSAMSDDGSDPAAALNDVPVICVLIDSILFKWAQGGAAILNTLVFSAGIVKPLWTSIQRSGLLDRIAAAARAAPPAPAASASSASALAAPSAVSYPLDSLMASDRFFQQLPLFCTLYGHLLLIQDDEEFFVAQRPFTLQEDVRQMVAALKTLLYHLFWLAFSPNGTPARLRERFSSLFVQLRDRQSRRPFLSPSEWLFADPINSIPIHTVQQEIAAEDQLREDLMLDPAAVEQQLQIPQGRSSSLVHSIPFVLPFADRVKLLYAHIELDKQRLRGSGVQFEHGLGRRINIRRASVLDDGFEALFGLSGNDLKGRVQVHFIDEHGLEEAGLDGGGLWKEFLSTLLTRAFDPSKHFWSETPEHFLYPNPNALDLPVDPASVGGEDAALLDELVSEHEEQTLQYFCFMGSMVGKALFDGIQFDAQFALFFLRSCVGHRNYLDDLQGLDAQLYSSLRKLKAMSEPDEIDALGLTFAVDKRVYGEVRSVELVPGGSSMAVTAENKMRFVYLLSDYYLRAQMARQAQAFQRGMWSMVPPQWLRMFAADELRLLLSGSPRVNLADLQAHTHYASGYSAQHEVIQWFWQVLGELTPEQVGLFLRFCTSCSRAPLLGFGSLVPGFCIQRVNADEGEQNLPTAATCMNLLRMPRFSSKQKLKDKLLYAITNASTGFALT